MVNPVNRFQVSRKRWCPIFHPHLSYNELSPFLLECRVPSGCTIPSEPSPGLPSVPPLPSCHLRQFLWCWVYTSSGFTPLVSCGHFVSRVLTWLLDTLNPILIKSYFLSTFHASSLYAPLPCPFPDLSSWFSAFPLPYTLCSTPLLNALYLGASLTLLLSSVALPSQTLFSPVILSLAPQQRVLGVAMPAGA